MTTKKPIIIFIYSDEGRSDQIIDMVFMHEKITDYLNSLKNCIIGTCCFCPIPTIHYKTEDNCIIAHNELYYKITFHDHAAILGSIIDQLEKEERTDHPILIISFIPIDKINEDFLVYPNTGLELSPSYKIDLTKVGELIKKYDINCVGSVIERNVFGGDIYLKNLNYKVFEECKNFDNAANFIIGQIDKFINIVPIPKKVISPKKKGGDISGRQTDS